MIAEFFELLAGWFALDTWIVITGALAAMSCALPGTWLLLRRQCLLGDALSHSVLPGIVLAYLAMHGLEANHWMSPTSGSRHLILFLGAALSGIFSAIVTELIQRWGRLDRGAAMGVVFTTLFALGLLLIRLFADKAHVDPACVLYGSLETSVLIQLAANIPIPQAAAVNLGMLLLNGILVIAFFKELRLSTFDPGLATALGLRADWIQFVLMGVTAATLVAAFESVGAILVIAMLIVPAATARLLTDHLGTMLILSLLIAALSALAGHVLALTLPTMLFSRLGYPDVRDASTAGMMAVAGGGFFLLAILGSPRHGALRRVIDQIRLRVRIAGEDLLGSLYRREEASLAGRDTEVAVTQDPLWGRFLAGLAQSRLRRRGLVTGTAAATRLTDQGRERAQSLVRSHRLWESYMARHFDLPGDHLHASAEQVEHFVCHQLQSELAAELDQPSLDPHGKMIPDEVAPPFAR